MSPFPSTKDLRQFLSLVGDLGVADGARLLLREVGVSTKQTFRYPGHDREYRLLFDPVWRWTARGERERGLQRIAEERMVAGSTVFDVGAHLGESTLLFSDLVGPKGRVVAFEPDPVACRILRKNLSMNAIANVTVEESSVTDSTGRVVIAADRLGSGLASVVEPATEGARRKHVSVASTTLDDYCESHDLVPEWVKVDAEGAEPLVILGMDRLIGSRHPSAIIEFHSVGMSEKERAEAWSTISAKASAVSVLESIPVTYGYLEAIPRGRLPNPGYLMVYVKY